MSDQVQTLIVSVLVSCLVTGLIAYLMNRRK